MAADNSQPPERLPCKSCAKPVKPGARVCPHCGAPQRRGWSVKQVLKICAGIVTLFSLLFAVDEGYRIWVHHRAVVAQLQQRLSAAQALVEVRDYETAWEMLSEAQRASPGSSELRAAQIDVAFSWLLEGFAVATGWIPRGGSDSPTESPGAVADLVHTPLVVAAALAEGEARADLDALIAWANLLRGRELRGQRRDLGPDFQRARDIAPEAFTPNLLLGYWQAAFDGDPEAAQESWNRALASGRDRPLVRRFQVSVLARTVMDDEGADRYRRALLRVLDDMERRHEPFPESLDLSAYERIYMSLRGERLHFASVADTIDPDRQLAVLEWARRGFRIDRDRTSFHHGKFQLIQALLLEQAGRPDAALAAIPETEEISGYPEHFQAHLDEIYERLTGEPPPDRFERDEWRAHAYYLSHTQPDDARFEAAMAALEGWAGMWDHVGNSLLSGKLPPALDAAVAAWEHQRARPEISAAERRVAAEKLRFLHLFRGHVRADQYDFMGGIAELEELARDPDISRPLRADIQFALAGAYTYSPRAPLPDFIYTEAARRVYEAYLYEGLDRLAAAIEAGFDDWDRIEKELPRLRELREYEPFSLRHGRVPPAKEEPE